MKSKDLFDAVGGADEELIDRCVQNKKRKPVWLKWSAIAACLCLAIIATIFGTPSGDNIFTVKAYALELAEGNTIVLREEDILNQPDVWGGYFDGTHFFVSIGLRYDGSNIKSVIFSTNEGFFAKQNINSLSLDDTVTKMYAGSENRLVLCGTEFEILGNKLSFDEHGIEDGELLFWGTQAADMSNVPETLEIHARAIFLDGKEQEVKIVIDLSGTGVYIPAV